MALSDAALHAAKPGEKQYKLHDGGGLFVIVRPSGGKLWRLKYRHLGKEQQLSLGAYPDVGLKDARERRDEARKIIAAGSNPAFEKKREHEGLKDITTGKARWLLSLLERDLGQRPIAEIEPYELLNVLKKVERSGRLETARRLLAFSGRVFRYAVATTRAKHNIAADLQGALTAPKVKHHAAIINPVGVGGLLRAIDGFDGQPTTQWALRLAPHVFVRPGELRMAEWSEIDLDGAVWRIPGARMKMDREHVVPLSTVRRQRQ